MTSYSWPASSADHTPARRFSRDWYVNVLEAVVFGEYGGTSVVLDLLGNWILLVTGGDPTPGKPTVTLDAPDDPELVAPLD